MDTSIEGSPEIYSNPIFAKVSHGREKEAIGSNKNILIKNFFFSIPSSMYW